ncbi:zinc-binding dehydrogenase [bacterium]|nr:zinc-binding dehydrogenase [bacterium]
MKAWQCNDERPLPGLALGEIDVPSPDVGEVLVRVAAAGITPSELQWYPTTHSPSGENRRHAVPGHEFSGVVVAAGAEAEIEPGSEVYGMNDWFADGAMAEFCSAPLSAITSKPASLSHAEAASVPISALTVWQGLIDRADLQPGERVLIHGGAGGVGVLALQLARWRGAHVVTTASIRHLDQLVELGAHEVIDYRTQRFEGLGQTFDVVFDGVGGETLARSWGVLSPGGRMVTIAAQSESEQDEKTKQAFFIVEPNREQLGRISGLFDSRTLKPMVEAAASFDQVPEAFLDQLPKTSGIGKTVMVL